MQLLLSCARSPAADGREGQIRALLKQVAWDTLLDSAEYHGLIPLLYWQLKQTAPEAVAPALEDRFQANVRNSVLLTNELIRLVELLRKSGIEALPFKGPTLALAAYGNLALRQFTDLDLLVDPSAAWDARSLLLANGFTTKLRLNPGRERAYLSAYDEFVLSGPGGIPLVELHWAITPRYFSVPLDIKAFWTKAVTVSAGQKLLPCLCPEDLLMVLILHGTKHCWSYLSLVADVAWLIDRNEIRWSEVAERARSLGCLRMLGLGIQLARDLVGTRCPPELDAAMRDAEVKLLADRVKAQIFDRKMIAGSITRAARFHMQARERAVDRVRYFVRLAATPGVEDWQAADLPGVLSPIYLFLRIPRLLGKYWGRTP